jgi:hypothetical protein
LPITMVRVRIKRWRTTAPSPEPSSRLPAAGFAPFPRSAGSITVTSASPDRERVQPRPPRSRKPPDGGPPASSQAAPSRICRGVAPLIPNRQGRRRQVQRSTHRRGMRRVLRFLTGTGRWFRVESGRSRAQSRAKCQACRGAVMTGLVPERVRGLAAHRGWLLSRCPSDRQSSRLLSRIPGSGGPDRPFSTPPE